jgi:hypothetical protein
MSNEICICIPKIDKNINKNFIQKTFEEYKIGTIKKIHLILSKEKNNKLCFIYFHKLNNTKNGNIVNNCIQNQEDFKIIYSFPWFWKCYKAKH